MDSRSQPPKKQTKTAVALSYDPNAHHAPKVVAKGKGTFAEKILSVAKENNVEIVSEETLVDELFALDAEREIPVELYDAVATVLAFVFKKQNQMKRRI